jgi:hypothetical protein
MSSTERFDVLIATDGSTSARAEMRRDVGESDARGVVTRAANAFPARLRSSAFAVLVELSLADGKLEGKERRFLRELGSDWKLKPERVEQILDVLVVENRL